MTKRKKKKSRLLPVIRTVTGFLLLIMYAAFAVTSLSLFKWMPWYDPDGSMQYMTAMLWIPECVLSVIHILLMLISGKLYRGRVILICINALYIPVCYLVGVLELSARGYLQFAAICAAVTTVIFAIVHIRSIRNKTV